MSYRRRVWLLSPILWTAVGLVVGIQVYLGIMDHGHKLWRVLLFQVLIWNGWFVIAPVIGLVARRFALVPVTGRAVAVHALAALVTAPIHSAWWTLLLVAMRPYDGMSPPDAGVAFGQIARSGLPLQLCIYAGIVAAHVAVDYYARYRDGEVSLSEARLHALEVQLRPHFLFNTLNSISALVRTERDREAVAMIAGLSDLLRYSLDHAAEQRVALAQELAVTERYLEIERLRFPDRVSFEVDAAPDVRRAAVPALLLQPLVENAIRHGIAPLAAPGRVAIRAHRDGAQLHIDLFNTGRLAADYRPGVGLRNTLDRLSHVYRGDHSFELRAGDGGVVASLVVPWSEVE